MNLFAPYVYKIWVLLSLLQGNTGSGEGWLEKAISLLVKAYFSMDYESEPFAVAVFKHDYIKETCGPLLLGFYFFSVNVPFLSDPPGCARGCHASVCSFQTSPPGENRTTCEWSNLNTSRLKPCIPNTFEFCLMLAPTWTISEAKSFAYRACRLGFQSGRAWGIS